MSLVPSTAMQSQGLAAQILNPAIWRRASILALVAANAVPLVCVVLFHWEVLPLMLLFWSENVVIGLFNVLKILTCSVHGAADILGKFFFAAFFTVHYGMFTLVHGVFVVGLFGRNAAHSGAGADQILPAISENHLLLPILGLAISHGVSYTTNYLRGGEYRRTSPPQLMYQPYLRVIILHVTILGGGILILTFKSPTAGLAALVVLKTIVDLAAHLRERAKFGTVVP